MKKTLIAIAVVLTAQSSQAGVKDLAIDLLGKGAGKIGLKKPAQKPAAGSSAKDPNEPYLCHVSHKGMFPVGEGETTYELPKEGGFFNLIDTGEALDTPTMFSKGKTLGEGWAKRVVQVGLMPNEEVMDDGTVDARVALSMVSEQMAAVGGERGRSAVGFGLEGVGTTYMTTSDSADGQPAIQKYLRISCARKGLMLKSIEHGKKLTAEMMGQ